MKNLLIIVFLIITHAVAYRFGVAHQENRQNAELITRTQAMLNHYVSTLEQYSTLANQYATEVHANMAARMDAEKTLTAYIDSHPEKASANCLDDDALRLLNHFIAPNDTSTTPTGNSTHPLPIIITPH